MKVSLIFSLLLAVLLVHLNMAVAVEQVVIVTLFPLKHLEEAAVQKLL
tara:strand:+ start:1895 stop:2038 length:144 start_codon:yes stop_codon:yes gene_type:complete